MSDEIIPAVEIEINADLFAGLPYLPPGLAVSPFGKPNVDKVVETCGQDPVFRDNLIRVLTMAAAARAAQDGGGVPDPKGVEAQSTIGVLVFSGPDYARANLPDFLPKRTRSGSQTDKDPWQEVAWYDAVSEEITRKFASLFMAEIVPTIRRATLDKSNENAIPNNGVPSYVLDRLDKAESGDLETIVEIVQCYAHNHGTRSKLLQHTDICPKFPAVEPLKGTVLHRNKDESVKMVGIVFGMGFDGLRPPPKPKTEPAPDTTAPVKTESAAPDAG